MSRTMWGRRDQEDTENADPLPQPKLDLPPASGKAPAVKEAVAPPPRRSASSGSRLGKSVVFKGEIQSAENLEVDGVLEGSISIPENALTVGVNSKVEADVRARSMVLHGSLKGDVAVSELIEIKKSGCLEGSLTTHRIIIEDGGIFRGNVAIHVPEDEGERLGPQASKPPVAPAEQRAAMSKPPVAPPLGPPAKRGATRPKPPSAGRGPVRRA